MTIKTNGWLCRVFDSHFWWSEWFGGENLAFSNKAIHINDQFSSIPNHERSVGDNANRVNVCFDQISQPK